MAARWVGIFSLRQLLPGPQESIGELSYFLKEESKGTEDQSYTDHLLSKPHTKPHDPLLSAHFRYGRTRVSEARRESPSYRFVASCKWANCSGSISSFHKLVWAWKRSW